MKKSKTLLGFLIKTLVNSRLAGVLLLVSMLVGCTKIDEPDKRYGAGGIYLGMSQAEVLTLNVGPSRCRISTNFDNGPDGVMRPALHGWFETTNGIVVWNHTPKNFGGRVMDITWGWYSPTEESTQRIVDQFIHTFGEPRLKSAPRPKPNADTMKDSKTVLMSYGWGGVKMYSNDVVREIFSSEPTVLLTITPNSAKGGDSCVVVFSDNIAQRKSLATIRE